MTEEKQNNNEIQINLGALFSYVFRKWWILLICLVVGVAGGFTLGKLTETTTYTTNATYLVYYDGGSSDLGDQSQDQYGISSILAGCREMAKQNRFYKAVAEEINKNPKYDVSYGTIASSLNFTTSSLSSVGNFIYVTVTSGYQDYTYDLMNAVVNIYPKYIQENYNMASDSSIIFSLINDIEQPSPVVNSETTKYTILGGLGLAVLAAVVLAVIYLVDTRVKGESELTATYDLPVLGSIPDFYDKQLEKTGYGYGEGGKKNG